LAISSSPVSLTELNQNFEMSQRRVKLLQSIDYLLKRSLIIKHGDTYSLMPIMKNYLRRKLVRTSLQSKDL
jgi:predicted transcriptional regulator